MSVVHCANCGQPVADAWCGRCGQRQPAAGDFSLRRFAAEAGEELSNADSRLWRTMVGIFQPGRLTRAYLDYQWQRYLPPLRLFLLASGVYFLLAWDPYFAINVAQMEAAPEDLVPAAVKQVFSDPQTSDRLSDMNSLLKFLFVVPMGLWIALLMWGNRRPIGEHMVFSMHYTTADFVFFSLAAPFLALTPADHRAPVFQAILLVVLPSLLLWAVLGVRRVYGRSWVSSVARGLLIVLMDLVLSTAASQLATIFVLTTSA